MSSVASLVSGSPASVKPGVVCGIATLGGAGTVVVPVPGGVSASTVAFLTALDVATTGDIFAVRTLGPAGTITITSGAGAPDAGKQIAYWFA